MTEMKLSKVLKKDVEKYLGTIPDKRRKDFKQFIAEMEDILVLLKP